MIAELAMNLEAKKKLYQRAKDAYYNTGHPIMTDEEFDRLEDQIKKADPKWSGLKAGAKIKNKKTKARLPIPMFSLDKTKPETVEKWLEYHSNEMVVVSDKEDGSSLEIKYEYGEPTKAYTRGNGTIGGDVSYLIPHLKIPQKVGKDNFIVRCEVLFTGKAFNKHSGDFDSARNAASGILNRTDIHPGARDLSVVVLQVLEPNRKPSQGLAWAKSKGFTVVPYKLFRASELNGAKLAKLLQARRAKSKYQMDGLVITLDKINKLPKAGNPDWAIAFKLNVETKDAPIATVKEVQWEVSPHGYLKPVIIYSPIQVEGAKLTRATAFNAKFVEVNKIGPGAQVKIIRSGEIIPKIVEVVKQAKKASLPDHKQFGPWAWNKTMVDIVLIKPTANEDFRVKVITRFMSNLEVDFMKEGNVRKLYEAGFDNIRKLLKATPKDFLRVEGVKETTANKLYEAIHSKIDKGVPVVKLMDASGTLPRGLGTTRLQQIADKWNMLKVCRLAADNPDRVTKAILKLPGWQIKMASAFVKGAPKFLKWLDITGIKPKLTKEKAPKAKTQKLAGIGVTWTGYRNKDEEATVVENGGTVESFGSKTAVLLFRPGGKESTKIGKAQAKGIPVLTWEQFAKKYKV